MLIGATTAEWLCTRCGATNRRLVPADATTRRGPLRHLPRAPRADPGTGRCGGTRD